MLIMNALSINILDIFIQNLTKKCPIICLMTYTIVINWHTLENT